LALVANVALRAEYLRYEFDEGQANVVRGGLTIKLQ